MWCRVSKGTLEGGEVNIGFIGLLLAASQISQAANVTYETRSRFSSRGRLTAQTSESAIEPHSNPKTIFD